jgi:hypothetical protein
MNQLIGESGEGVREKRKWSDGRRGCVNLCNDFMKVKRSK